MLLLTCPAQVIGAVGGLLLVANHLSGAAASAALVRALLVSLVACTLRKRDVAHLQSRTEVLGVLLGILCIALPSVGERLEEVRSRHRCRSPASLILSYALFSLGRRAAACGQTLAQLGAASRCAPLRRGVPFKVTTARATLVPCALHCSLGRCFCWPTAWLRQSAQSWRGPPLVRTARRRLGSQPARGFFSRVLCVGCLPQAVAGAAFRGPDWQTRKRVRRCVCKEVVPLPHGKCGEKHVGRACRPRSQALT